MFLIFLKTIFNRDTVEHKARNPRKMGYLIEQNRTKIQSNTIERLGSAIEQNRTCLLKAG